MPCAMTLQGLCGSDALPSLAHLSMSSSRSSSYAVNLASIRSCGKLILVPCQGKRLAAPCCSLLRRCCHTVYRDPCRGWVFPCLLKNIPTFLKKENPTMTPLLKELSELEVEPLEIIADDSLSSQDRSLDILAAPSGDLGSAALLTGKGIFPVNGPCCCCCGPTCCCC